MQTPPPVGVEKAPDLTMPSDSSAHSATGVEALCESASAASGQAISPTLYNVDLAPTKRAGRSWSGYSIFTLWANDVHSLGNYAFAIGLFALAWRAPSMPLALAALLAALVLLLAACIEWLARRERGRRP